MYSCVSLIAMLNSKNKKLPTPMTCKLLVLFVIYIYIFVYLLPALGYFNFKQIIPDKVYL